MNKIKFRRGSLNNKKNIDIEDGEPIYLTDTKRLYVSNEDVAINNVYVGTQEPNDPGINVWINPEGINNVVDMIYPIGSIYLSVNNVNPSSIFGGSWESFGTGRTLVGVDTGQTEFNTVEKIGGSKHLQEHRHNYLTTTITYNDYGDGGEVVAIPRGATNRAVYKMSEAPDVPYANSGNLQPYITVYMWKRVD